LIAEKNPEMLLDSKRKRIDASAGASLRDRNGFGAAYAAHQHGPSPAGYP
jgi:hypothetical protein